MELFSGGLLDRKVMEALGCSEYHFTHWETIKPDVQLRQIDYQFSSTSGNAHYQGKVISSQQKTKLSEKNGWLIEEVITPQGGVPYGEYFNVCSLPKWLHYFCSNLTNIFINLFCLIFNFFFCRCI